ncbi:TetR/AcrR family transcriptional regulator [Modestobacter versicolor]|uniref:TetR/AcrR family transcriptional regulator n=1 Tax=Modestobacter versicolor TaxID=429133 RepID=UPI0034DE1408
MSRPDASIRAEDPRPARTRAAIFTSVERLSANAAADVTVNAIVRGAGVSRSAFYAQFPDLEALAVAMLVDTLEDLGIAPATPTATGPPDVRAAIHRLSSHIASRRTFYRAALDWRLTSTVDEKIVDAYARQIREVIRLLGDAVPPELRHDDAALFIAGGMVSLVTRWLRDSDAEPYADPQVLTDRLLSVVPGRLTGKT